MLGAAGPFCLITFLTGWLSKDLNTGLVAALVTLGLFTLFAMANIFLIKELSLVDVFLPIPIAAIRSILLLPLDIAMGNFSVPSSIGAGIILTYVLWMYKFKYVSKAYLILPILVFMYEMLPVDIPGPIDNYLGLSGIVVNAILVSMNAQAKQISSFNSVISTKKLIN